ncbi:MAG: hypothetical protein BWZ06_01768 [Bacteroidetes bacterium ADurb.BinA261]|nr:MAG: hypothetical protein BWZ06_01768 [Bacteroidetes bacterium ADurb.BinA261]
MTVMNDESIAFCGYPVTRIMLLSAINTKTTGVPIKYTDMKSRA